jgi:hypothetical protein
MTTFTFPFQMPFCVIPVVRRSWLIAITEAVWGGVGALLLGAATVDPEVGFSR